MIGDPARDLYNADRAYDKARDALDLSRKKGLSDAAFDNLHPLVIAMNVAREAREKAMSEFKLAMEAGYA